LSGGTAPAADATSGATPKSGLLTFTWDCTDQDGQPVPAGEYHFLVEGTIFWKDAILFEGVITVGSGESTAQAAASYTTEEAKKSDMITGVEAIYKQK
jgi:flagellar hook assembly protein FlgD